MNLKKFNSFEDNNRILVYVFDRRLSESEHKNLTDILKDFTSTWKAHNDDLKGDFCIYDQQIVILAVKKNVSGCSLDSSTRIFKTFRSIHGVNALDNSLLFFIDEKKKIQKVTKSKLTELIKSEVVKEDTLVIDTTITTIKELRRGDLQKPFKASWHKKIFPLPAPLT